MNLSMVTARKLARALHLEHTQKIDDLYKPN